MNQAFYGDFGNRRPSGVWTTLNRLVIGVIILALCIGAAVTFIPIFKQRSEESARIEQLRGEIARQKALLSRNTREVELLKNDPEYLEMMARDRLDMMKPGETIIRLEPAVRTSLEAVPPLPAK